MGAAYPRTSGHWDFTGPDAEKPSPSDTSNERIACMPDKKEAGSTCHSAPGQVVRRGMRLYFHHAVAK